MTQNEIQKLIDQKDDYKPIILKRFKDDNDELSKLSDG